jgi:hypothetical protein
MSKTLDFTLIANEDGTSFVLDSQYLKAVDLSEEALVEAFGDRAKKHSVVLKDQNFAMKRAINRAASVPDLILGWKLDPDMVPSARAQVCIDHWSFDAPVTVAGFDSLPYLVGEFISAEITKYLFPDVASDPTFTTAWTARLESSAAKQ